MLLPTARPLLLYPARVMLLLLRLRLCIGNRNIRLRNTKKLRVLLRNCNLFLANRCIWCIRWVCIAYQFLLLLLAVYTRSPC